MSTRWALISVTDKEDLVSFATGLVKLGFSLLSTGGSAQTLRDGGLEVTDVAQRTGFPEMLDGRVKTLHPSVHAGILARATDDHLAQLAAQSIAPIDLVVVNLYQFAKAAEAGAEWNELVESIDIGGPTLIRAAAKNCERVAVVTHPDQYEQVLGELTAYGEVRSETRRHLAVLAFQYTASYDAVIAQTFWSRGPDRGFPTQLSMTWRKANDLRYGENPHQVAALYCDPSPQEGSLAAGKLMGGKALSYNNLVDAEAALALIREFDRPAVAVIKHTNPCGAAVADTIEEAYKLAVAGDPLSAFGGIVACNRAVSPAVAETVVERFFEVVVAPDFSLEAVEILRRRENMRLLEVGECNGHVRMQVLRAISGGLLIQTIDNVVLDDARLKVVTDQKPTAEQWADLRFGWTVCKHVKSNAIVLVKDGQVVGVGAGQMSRVDAVVLAVRKAGERARGSVLASDAFFPFPDGIEEAAKAGVVAVIQPGGSKRDDEVTAAADEHHLPMVMTGIRHFRH